MAKESIELGYTDEQLRDATSDPFVPTTDRPKPVLNHTNYLPNAVVLYNINNYFYSRAEMFWVWNKQKKVYEKKDDIDMMLFLEQHIDLTGETVAGHIKGQYLESFKRVGRLRIPKEPPKTWIQFREQIFDIETSKIFDATPEYFYTNTIPFSLTNKQETPVIDKLFKEWVGEEYVDTLYDILAYCCVRDTPIHTLFCLIGAGRNGKSQFLKLLIKFLGKENVCSTELDVLQDSRFEASKLYKKLACTMGETNFGTITKSSIIKKLTGGDLISYEYKNKQPFEETNYAKIILSTNSLPSTLDTSDGFYRRWIILRWDNEFPEGKDIVDIIPEEEYSHLATKIAHKAKMLIHRGTIHKSGTIEERKHNFIMASNPIGLFIQEFCVKQQESFLRYGEMLLAYNTYLMQNKRRKIGVKEFVSSLENEGFFVENTSIKIKDDFFRDRWIRGLAFRQEKIGTLGTIGTAFLYSSLYIENSVKNEFQKFQSFQKSDEKDVLCDENYKNGDKMMLPCVFCDISPTHAEIYMFRNRPTCYLCCERILDEEKTTKNE